MNVQFSIYEINKETRQIIDGTLLIADNEKIFDLFREMDLYPFNSEFPDYNYLELDRIIKIEGKSYRVTNFRIRTTNGGDIFKIFVYVIGE